MPSRGFYLENTPMVVCYILKYGNATDLSEGRLQVVLHALVFSIDGYLSLFFSYPSLPRDFISTCKA